jgi:hypothetical protein
MRYKHPSGKIYTSKQMKRMFRGKLPSPATRRLLGYTDVKESAKPKTAKSKTAKSKRNPTCGAKRNPPLTPAQKRALHNASICKALSGNTKRSLKAIIKKHR